MIQIRFRGSEAFAASCTGRPLSSAFPNSPEWSPTMVAAGALVRTAGFGG